MSREPMRKVVYHDFDNKLHTTWIPEPAPPDRKGDFLLRIKRSESTSLFTRRVYYPDAIRHGLPQDSHLTWTVDPHISWPDPDSVPPYINLTDERAGRLVHGTLDTRSSIAVFPADAANPYCPPYPGSPPPQFHEGDNSITCFSDGSLAKWDPRYYPQVYDPRRPWIPFHDAPREITISETPFASEFNVEPSHLCASHFYYWYTKQLSDKGLWNRRLIANVFVERKKTEASLEHNLGLLHAAQQKNGLELLDLSSYDLPVLDTLTFEETENWITYQEGRDGLGRMCRYIAELGAMSRWIHCIRLQLKSNPPGASNKYSARPDIFMGAWSSKDMRQQDWDMLYQARIPIYVIAESSPYSTTESSPFDCWERHRTNRLEGSFDVANAWKKVAYPMHPQENTQAVWRHFPLSLTSPLIKQLEPRSNSWLLPWTWSPIHDPNNPPVIPSELPWFPNHKSRLFQEQSHQLFSFVGPHQKVLVKELDHHPFFNVCPRINSRRIMFYKERYDPNEHVFYFKEVEPSKSNAVATHSPYIFHWPQESVTVYSKYPYPGRPDNFCRNRGVEDVQYDQRLKGDRTYVWRIGGEKWEWNAPTASTEDPLPDDTNEPPSSIPPYEADEMELVFSHDDFFDEPIAPTHSDISSPLPRQEHISRLEEQRIQVQYRSIFRLFKPIKGNALNSDDLVPWTMTNTIQGGSVWPIRIARFHNDVKLEAVIQRLNSSYGIATENILAACWYEEIDNSRTLDIGLRYSEDALWLWCLLHGVLVDEQCLEVHPIRALDGTATVIEVSPTNTTIQDRVYRFQSIAALISLWPFNGRFENAVQRWEKEAIQADILTEDMRVSTLSVDQHIAHSIPSLIDTNDDSSVQNATTRKMSRDTVSAAEMTRYTMLECIDGPLVFDILMEKQIMSR